MVRKRLLSLTLADNTISWLHVVSENAMYIVRFVQYKTDLEQIKIGNESERNYF